VIHTLDELTGNLGVHRQTGVLREDVIELSVHMSKEVTGVKGDAYRSLLGEAHRYPELLARFKSEVLLPRFGALDELLHDAAARGEIARERLTPVVLEVLHALIIKRLLLEASDLTRKDIAAMVDEVLLPLLARPAY
jgi:hypothetical protein